MKKIFLVTGLFLSVWVMHSQEFSNHAIGLRFGDNDGLGAEVSYQKKLTDANRLELGLAWRSRSNYDAIKLTGTYQWIFDLEAIEGVNWYVGAGGGLGSWSVKNNFTGDDGAFLFLAGVIGTEYTFDFPLQLSLDFRPELGFVDYNNDLGLDIALGVRYVF